MLDMALSVVAGGKLKMAIAKGERIPLDWATDRDGNPTDDPQKGFDGYFLPLGGFKGLGMAYAIDILCGVMTGGAFQNHIKNMFKDPTEPSRTCHMFMAVDLVQAAEPGGDPNGNAGISRLCPQHPHYLRPPAGPSRRDRGSL